MRRTHSPGWDSNPLWGHGVDPCTPVLPWIESMRNKTNDGNINKRCVWEAQVSLGCINVTHEDDPVATAQTEGRPAGSEQTDSNSFLAGLFRFPLCCLLSLYWPCMPVTIKLSASLVQYETQVSLHNLCLSSPIPPSPPECNKCPAIIYFNSLPSCTDEMDS